MPRNPRTTPPLSDADARDRLRRLLERSRMNQTVFGAVVMAGVNRSSIYRWLGGAPIPRQVRAWLAGVRTVIPGLAGTVVVVFDPRPDPDAATPNPETEP